MSDMKLHFQISLKKKSTQLILITSGVKANIIILCAMLMIPKFLFMANFIKENDVCYGGVRSIAS